MPGQHARLAPSAASRWVNCPGQPVMAGRVPAGGDSVYAAQGTAAHYVLERCMTYGFEPHRYVDQDVRGHRFTDEDAEAVAEAVTWLRGEILPPDDEVQVETRLRWSDDLWGTSDFSRYRPSNGELLVADYKHGSGVLVEAFENIQLLIYALMRLRALGNRGVSRVRVVIIQPRIAHRQGPVREFSLDGIDMLEWAARIEEAVAAVDRAAAAVEREPTDRWERTWLHAGAHCTFCPAKAVCPAQAALAREALADAFTPVAGYSVEHLARALTGAAQLKAYAKSLVEFAYAEAERGVQIPGFKLVPKRATERWKDVAILQGALDVMGVPEAERFEPAEVKSPARIRAALAPHMPGKSMRARTAAAKAFLADYTMAVSSGHSLVSADDDRDPSQSSVADVFDPLD